MHGTAVIVASTLAAAGLTGIARLVYVAEALIVHDDVTEVAPGSVETPPRRSGAFVAL